MCLSPWNLYDGKTTIGSSVTLNEYGGKVKGLIDAGLAVEPTNHCVFGRVPPPSFSSAHDVCLPPPSPFLPLPPSLSLPSPPRALRRCCLSHRPASSPAASPQNAAPNTF